LYGQYINGIIIFLIFIYSPLCYEIEVGIYEKFAKMWQWFHEEITPRCNHDARFLSPWRRQRCRSRAH